MEWVGCVDEFERSQDLALPWRLDIRGYRSEYGRRSSAIVDANGRVVLLLDPSESEYDVACSKETALAIVDKVNALNEDVVKR